MKEMSVLEYVKAYSWLAFQKLPMVERRQEAYEDVTIFVDAEHGIMVVDRYSIGD